MNRYKIKYYSLKSKKFSYGHRLRIVFITDMHNIDMGNYNQHILEKIKALQPDLILIGGDLIVGKPGASMDAGLLFARNLAKIAPVYAGLGNHEYRLGLYPETYGHMYEQYTDAMKKSGIILLLNESSTIVMKGTKLQIQGFNLPASYYSKLYRGSLPYEILKEAMPSQEEDAFRILLAHHPKYFPTYAMLKPDLVLSGHYHGGIIRLPFKKPLVGTDFTLFPKYAWGKYKKGHTNMIVSAGLGEHTIPLRINNPRELVVVDLGR